MKVLRALDSLEAVLPGDLSPFLAYFRAFKKVRDAAFNSHTYDTNCRAYVEEAIRTGKALGEFGITVIPKMHLLLHVPAFCEAVNAPLGKFGDRTLNRFVIMVFD